MNAETPLRNRSPFRRPRKAFGGFVLLAASLLLAGTAAALDVGGAVKKAAKATGSAATRAANAVEDAVVEADVDAALLSDRSAIAPGESFYVGLRLRIEKGWHIYGKRPGDAGMATRVQWNLPEGFEAGVLLWPRAQAFDSPGEITGYGYSGEVMLVAEITAPAELPTDGEVEISAAVQWLACRQECVPGSANPSIELEVRDEGETDESAAEQIARWRERALPAAPDFSLRDSDGREWTLSDQRGEIVVLEWFNPDCPFVKRHHQQRRTMVELAEEFALRGDVTWMAINSTHYMTAEKTGEWARKWNLTYPVLIDRDGSVGRAFGAKTTPHIFIVDADGQLAYIGAIDDDPAGNRDPAETTNYVRQALEDLLAGRPVRRPQTRQYGCSVKYAPEGD
jgi:DsbC/DsbD-like thiol-disulfide interchange protein